MKTSSQRYGAIWQWRKWEIKVDSHQPFYLFKKIWVFFLQVETCHKHSQESPECRSKTWDKKGLNFGNCSFEGRMSRKNESKRSNQIRFPWTREKGLNTTGNMNAWRTWGEVREQEGNYREKPRWRERRRNNKGAEMLGLIPNPQPSYCWGQPRLHWLNRT